MSGFSAVAKFATLSFYKAQYARYINALRTDVVKTTSQTMMVFIATFYTLNYNAVKTHHVQKKQALVKEALKDFHH